MSMLMTYTKPVFFYFHHESGKNSINYLTNLTYPQLQLVRVRINNGLVLLE